MTDGNDAEWEWSLPSRTDAAANAADAVDPREVLERVDSLTVYAWEAPDDDVPDARVGPAAEDVAERFADDDSVTAADVDGVCLAAIQGLHDLAAEQRDRIEAQQATIRTQRDDLETLRERVEALQATLAERRRDGDESQ